MHEVSHLPWTGSLVKTSEQNLKTHMNEDDFIELQDRAHKNKTFEQNLTIYSKPET